MSSSQGQMTGQTSRTSRVLRFSTFRRMAVILRNRPDTEHEMTINRLVIIGIVLLYLAATALLGMADSAHTLTTYGSFFGVCYLISLGLFAHILYRPGESPTRRMMAIGLDMSMLMVGMHVGNEAMALLYPIFLWIILGNGFRFGVRYLLAATGAAVLAFGAVLLTTEFWLALPTLGLGLLAGLIVIPAYASTLVRKLSQAKHQAEQASKSKSLFLASVSHELRTPLNAVITLSDLLKASRLDDDQRDMAETIGVSGRSLLSLINTILDFSRLEAGRMPIRSMAFDLHATLRQVERILAVQAGVKGLRFSLFMSFDTPRMIKGDPRHLEEILLNLGGNAVKFTASGHVLIAVTRADATDAGYRLRFEVIDSGIGIAPEAQARIFESFTQADESIIDRFGGTGLGLAIVRQLVEQMGGTIGLNSVAGQGSSFWFEIDMDQAEQAVGAPEHGLVLPRPFLISQDRALETMLTSLADVPTPAASFDEIEAMLVRHTGRHRLVIVDERELGIDVSEAALRLHAAASGRLDLILVCETQDQPDQKIMSLFRTVMARPLDLQAARMALEIVARGDAVSSAGMLASELREVPAVRSLNILVAEDNRTNQKVVERLLENDGHRVTIVEDGEQAVEALNAEHFDLVLMDINMPVLNGIEATKLHRFAALGRPRVPIYALTADVTLETQARCEEADMDGCLGKPIELARLHDVLALVAAQRTSGGFRDAHAPLAGPVALMAETEGTLASAMPTGEAINARTLDDLTRLGGREFVDDLVTQFVGDAADVLRDLAQAVAEADVSAFREQAHALRSGAANIGAQGIYEMCLAWRQIDMREMAARGEEHVRQLEEEFERVRDALHDHLADQDHLSASGVDTPPQPQPRVIRAPDPAMPLRRAS